MDPSAVNTNVTVDDFDSVLSYADQSDWETPDPSSPSFNDTNSPWLMGTYHKTEIVGAELSFNFTGPAIYVYGHAGPSYGSYSVQIDSFSANFSSYTPNNASTPHLLYGANNLTYGSHNLVLRNLGTNKGETGGNTFLFDYLQATIQVAPAGASVSNVTYEEDNKALTYTGVWGNNTGPVFSGGGTAYTNAEGASVSLTFNGSAIYIFGDKKNDHGLYTVALDDSPLATYSGISGCGGAFGQTCEQQKPTLQFLASNLGDGEHKVVVTNLAGVNASFLDIDSFVVTVPSNYTVRPLSNDSSPFVGSGSSSGTSASPSGTSAPGNNSNSAYPLFAVSNPVLLLALALCWFVRRW
ncbi:hypothetical protein BDQ17DRAFT_741085 [Cyathus striatus]|nr:hypothetical protein BDQ17DRAFT_1261444 [Cyathus striatus]KAF8999883.1 hypothetical protein BDQ17DRAFT_741085 [Cyathus striatus]